MIDIQQGTLCAFKQDAFSGAPQDVPLALCDKRSVSPQDLIIADAIFDPPGAPEWRFDSWVVAANPARRWHWFPDLTRDEVLLFQSSDSRDGRAVPHVAFDNPADLAAGRAFNLQVYEAERRSAGWLQALNTTRVFSLSPP